MQRCQTNGYGIKTTLVNINIAGGCSGAPEVRYHRFWTPIYIIYHISMEWFKGKITGQIHINGKVDGFL